MATHTESAAEDRQDMQRLVQGVDAALDTLMQRHGAPIIRYLHRMVGDEEEANDLAQETFARIYQHRSRFDPQQVFSTWAYTIAGNLARDFLRRRKRRPTDSLEAQVAETNLSLRETIPDGHPLAPDQLQAREQRNDAKSNRVSALSRPKTPSLSVKELVVEISAGTLRVIRRPP